MSVRTFTGVILAATIQNLRTTSVTQTTIALAWDVYPGATGYEIRRNGTLVQTWNSGTQTTYSNSGHTAGTSYTYAVRPVVGGSGVASAEASIVVTTIGTTYFAWSCSSLSYEFSPVAPYQAMGGMTLVTDGGRTVARYPVLDNSGSVGFGTLGPIPLGTSVYGTSFFFRVWLKFEAGFSWGSVRGRSKFMRLGQPGESPMVSINMTSGREGGNGFWFEWDSVDALPNQYLTYNFDPVVDPTLFDWNEFVLELRQRSSSSATDGYARLYRNGVLVSTLNNQIWTNRTGSWYAMWGSLGTSIYPQLNYTGTPSGGGGYLLMRDQAATNFWSSAYQQGS